jgi:phage terminase large subunit-like protein
VKGFGSSVRGAHPYWIIVDDGLKDNVIYSLEQRNKSINYFHSVIMNMITPNGQVIVVGTPFHGSDLYGDLKSKEGWKVFEYPGIYPNGNLLWENRWSFKGLMEKRASQGNLIFSREILCRPITSDSSIFPIEIMNNAIHRMSDVKLVRNRESYHMKFDRVVVGVDFAISSSVGADFTVITVWGIDNTDKMWLMEAIMEKGMTYGQQIATLKNINVNFQPEVMVLENNVFQQIYVQQSELEGLPVVGHTTGIGKNDLEKGWAGLALLFERGMIKIPTGDQRSKDFADALIMQFGSVAFTDKGGLQSTDGHDDICSSTWLGSIAVKKVVTGAFNFNFI